MTAIMCFKKRGMTSDLEVEGCTGFGELAEEVIMESGPQDVLSVRLVGVKGQLLKTRPPSKELTMQERIPPCIHVALMTTAEP